MVPLPTAEIDLQTVMFAAGCGLLTMFLLRMSLRYFAKQRRRSGSIGPAIAAQPRPKGPWDGVQQDQQARFDRQQVELHDLGREIMGQIDSKMILLQHLIAQSEQQVERLEALLGRDAGAAQATGDAREAPSGNGEESPR